MVTFSTVLITINVQNDFFPGGVYPLTNAEDRLRQINSLREHADVVVHSRLLLQPNHYSFRSCNPGTELGDPVVPRDQTARGLFRGRQRKPQREIKECIVNPYCVRGSPGSDFHPGLIIAENDVVMEHGFDPSEGNYSLFSLKIHDQPILSAHFRKAEVTRIIIAGFGYEYSVLHTALDACQLSPTGHQMEVIVVADACCPAGFVIGMDQVADDELLSAGVHILSSYEIPVNEEAVTITEADLENDVDVVGIEQADIQWQSLLHKLAADTSTEGTKRLKQLAHNNARRCSPFALDWFGNSALIVAARSHNTVAVNVLLVLLSDATSQQSGAESKAGRTAAAATTTDAGNGGGAKSPVKAIHRLKRKTRLLKHVNHQGLHGMTALMWAAACHDLQAVKALIRHGALPMKGVSLGNQNAMIFATSMHLNNLAFSVVRELFKVCSRKQAAKMFTAADKRGWSAFHFASLNGLLGDLDLSMLAPADPEETSNNNNNNNNTLAKRSSQNATTTTLASEKSATLSGPPSSSRAKGGTDTGNSKRVVPISSGTPPTKVVGDRAASGHRPSSSSWSKPGSVTITIPSDANNSDASPTSSTTTALARTRSRPSSATTRTDTRSNNIFRTATSKQSLTTRGVPIDQRTLDNYAPLHLAAWSGASASIVALLDLVEQDPAGGLLGSEDIFAQQSRISRFINRTVDRLTPLDLMIQEGHSHCIPLLLKQNAFAKRYRGDRCTELLHRSILFGDQSTAERILQFDENEVDTSTDVLRLVDSLQHVFPASCTSTYTKLGNGDGPGSPGHDDSSGEEEDSGLGQYLYRCVRCATTVCLVCRERCHKDHGPSERLGICSEREGGVCHCDKASCCALGSASIREMEGYRYDPSPVDTKNLHNDQPALSDEGLSDRATPLGRLAFDLARNSHEVWAKQRQEDGWRYGTTRDDSKKVHPSLRPFGQLSDRDRAYNESAAREAIRVVHSFAFAIVPDDTPSEMRRFSMSLRRSRTGRGPRLMTDSSASLLSVGSRRASVDRSMMSVLEIDHTHPARVLSRSDSADSELSGTADAARSVGGPNSGSATSNSVVASAGGTAAEPKAGDSGGAAPPSKDGLGIKTGSATTTAPTGSGPPSPSTATLKYQPSTLNMSDVRDWKASPVDTQHVFISHKLSNLIELLAKNDHDVWARSKIKMGWRFAPGRVSEKAMTTPMLVPYEMLSTAEKSRLRQSAVEMVKIVLHSGFKITCTNATVSGNLIRRLRERERQMLSGGTPKRPTSSTLSMSNPASLPGSPSATKQRVEDASKIQQFKVAVRTALLMRAARSGDADAVRYLLQKLPKTSVNHCDHFKHTPLYLAVKRGHTDAVEVLLSFKADASHTDINQLTPLSIAAQLGNAEMCDLLIRLTKEQSREETPQDGRTGGGGLFRDRVGSETASTQKQARIRRMASQDNKLPWKTSATVLTCDRWGLSPLHRAACLNHTDVCKVIYTELATMKDMDIDLTGLAHVSRVLSVLKNKAQDVARSTSGGVLHHSTGRRKNLPAAKMNSGGHRSPQRAMSARDLVTHQNSFGNSAFLRGMQDLTQRLFGKLGQGAAVGSRATSPTAKVTPHQLVALKQHEESSAASRERWQTLKHETVDVIHKNKEAARRVSASIEEEVSLRTMQEDIDRIGVGIFAPTTPLGMAVCLRCLDAVSFLVEHGADPTLTTPIKIYREKHNDSLFGKLKNLKDRLLYKDDLPGNVQNHGMSPYQVALFVYHELRMIRQNIENDRSDDPFLADDSATNVLRSLTANIEMASKMVDELNAARATKSVRDWFAVRRCSTGIIPNLIMWVLLLSASPSFYDGYLNYDSFVFKREVETTFNSALDIPGATSNDAAKWLDHWRRDASLDGLLAHELGSVASGGAACRVQFNQQASFLVGPLQFQIRKFPRSLNCSAANNLGLFGQEHYPAVKPASLPAACYEAFDGYTPVQSRTDLDGDGVWFDMPYTCDTNGAIRWANWTNETTAAMLGLDDSMVYGGASYGTADYFDAVGAVSDVQIRGVLYHPDLNRFVTVDMLALFQPSGAVNIQSRADAAQFEGRFPPSIEFEIIVLMVMLLAIIEMVRAITRKDGVTDSVAISGGNAWQRMEHCLRRVWGYLLLDASIVVLAAVLFSFDVYLLSELSNIAAIDLFNRSDTHPGMFDLMDLVLSEQQLAGLVVFVLGFRLVKYLRFLPVCGPEIISIVMTVFHREVLLYVTVVCLVLALFSISGQVVFGSWIDLTPMTFIRIFNLNFAEKKNDFFNNAAPGVEDQVIVMGMYLFYIIFALVALNLFIGLVTQWYPKIRAESHRQWHYILTREMAYSTYNTFSFRCNGVGTMNRTAGLSVGNVVLSDPTKLESVCFKAAIHTPISTSSLLRGMDGERYWHQHTEDDFYVEEDYEEYDVGDQRFVPRVYRASSQTPAHAVIAVQSAGDSTTNVATSSLSPTHRRGESENSWDIPTPAESPSRRGELERQSMAPSRSPSRSPRRSPRRSPMRSPTRSPRRSSPMRSPMRSPQRRQAHSPITPHARFGRIDSEEGPSESAWQSIMANDSLENLQGAIEKQF